MAVVRQASICKKGDYLTRYVPVALACCLPLIGAAAARGLLRKEYSGCHAERLSLQATRRAWILCARAAEGQAQRAGQL